MAAGRSSSARRKAVLPAIIIRFSHASEHLVLISTAYAQTGGAAAPEQAAGGFAGLPFLILMFVVLWFLMIRPQMKRAKEHKAMVEALAKGDEVVTNGGIIGKVTELGDNYVRVEIAANTVVAVQKQAIVTVLPKGSLKAL
jgi:preprotein translocase subunit YajC